MKIQFLIFLLISCNAHSQQKDTNSYLLIRITGLYDYTAERNFYTIIAEGGCDDAKEIYALKKFNDKKTALNTENSFYYNHSDTIKNYYNYFLTSTEALNFISKKQWVLVSIYSETFSGSDLVRSGNDYVPLTTVSSRPVFCFKR